MRCCNVQTNNGQKSKMEIVRRSNRSKKKKNATELIHLVYLCGNHLSRLQETFLCASDPRLSASSLQQRKKKLGNRFFPLGLQLINLRSLCPGFPPSLIAAPFFQQSFVTADEAAAGSRCDFDFSPLSKM